MAIGLDYLKSMVYFAGVSETDLAAIAPYLHERHAARLDVIQSEGEPSRGVHFVISGVVKVFKTSPDGKEQTLRLVRPGESFCDASVLGGMPNLASAQALGPVVLYEINKADLEMVVLRSPKVALNVIRLLSFRIRDLVGLIEDLSFKNVTGRIAGILLEHSGELKSGPRLTQQEMAAMAGTVREVVGRSLKTLEETGTIRMDHHRIVIRDRQALGRVAGLVQ